MVLRSHLLVGRSAACDLRVDDPRVSGEHLRLRWTGAVWEARDLGSKNGTFLGERRLAAGERAPVLAGDTSPSADRALRPRCSPLPTPRPPPPAPATRRAGWCGSPRAGSWCSPTTITPT